MLLTVISYKHWLTINVTGSSLSISTTIKKGESSNAIINILKKCSDKKTERVIKSAAFLSSAVILPHLAHSWPGLNYV